LIGNTSISSCGFLADWPLQLFPPERQNFSFFGGHNEQVFQLKMFKQQIFYYKLKIQET